MKVICISGKAQHGKDTTAGILKDQLESRGCRVLIAHYADLLKYICRTFFGWDGNKDRHGRAILQHVGTDVIRQKAPDYWVRFLSEFLTLFEGEWDYVLIPDTRFPNEVDVMRDRFGAVHLRVVRPGFVSPLTPEQLAHPSETALDDTIPDYCIENSGYYGELVESVNTWIKEIIYADKSES